MLTTDARIRFIKVQLWRRVADSRRRARPPLVGLTFLNKWECAGCAGLLGEGGDPPRIYADRAPSAPLIALGGSSSVISEAMDTAEDVQVTLAGFGSGWYQTMIIILIGIGFATDGMEMFVMSLILPELPAEWNLSDAELGMLGGVVFIGMAIGAATWGLISDRIGRRICIILTLALSLLFGMLSAASQSWVTLAVLRLGFGFGVGGLLPVGSTLLVESSPPESASFSIAASMNLFSLGATLEALFAVYILPALGWSWLLVVSALPLALPLIALPFVGLVESPVWLASQGETQKARRSLARIAEANGAEYTAEIVPDPLAVPGVTEKANPAMEAERLKDKESKEAERQAERKASWLEFVSYFTTMSGLRLSVPLLLTWTLTAFTYYGVVFVLPTWFADNIPEDLQYWATFFTAIAELPGNWIAAFCCDRYGRKRTIAVAFLIGAVLTLVNGIVASSDGVRWQWVLVMACFTKATVVAPFSMLYLYTPEAFPTHIRNLALGFFTVAARVGAAVSPIFGQTLYSVDVLTAMGVYSATSLAGVVAAMALPFDTKDRNADAVARAEASEGHIATEETPLRS